MDSKLRLSTPPGTATLVNAHLKDAHTSRSSANEIRGREAEIAESRSSSWG
jgi:hypothetical protein